MFVRATFVGVAMLNEDKLSVVVLCRIGAFRASYDAQDVWKDAGREHFGMRGRDWVLANCRYTFRPSLRQIMVSPSTFLCHSEVHATCIVTRFVVTGHPGEFLHSGCRCFEKIRCDELRI